SEQSGSRYVCLLSLGSPVSRAYIVFPQPARTEVVSLIVRLPSSASNNARTLPSPLPSETSRHKRFSLGPPVQPSRYIIVLLIVLIVLLARKNRAAMRTGTIKMPALQ